MTLVLVVIGFSLGISTVAVVLVSRSEISTMNRDTKQLLRESQTKTSRDFAIDFAQQVAKILFNPVYKAEIGSISEIGADVVKSPLIAALEVRDAKGRVMWGSRGVKPEDAFTPLGDKPLRLRAARGGLLLDAEIRVSNVRAGFLRMVISNDNLKKTIARREAAEDAAASRALRRQLLALAGIAVVLFLLGLLVSRAWAQRLIAPLEQLKAGAQLIIDGATAPSLRQKTGDEIEVLSNSLDLMVRSEKDLRDNLLESNRRLRGSEIRLAATLSSMANALLVTDETGKIDTVNQATAAMLGYRESDLREKTFWELLAEPPATRDLGRYVERDKELLFKSRSGDSIPTSFTGSFLELPDGGIAGFVGVAHDLRETMKLLLERAQAVADKERALELQRVQEELVEVAHQAGMAEIATGVIHNIGNVLNTLNISTGEIREVLADSELATLVRLTTLLTDHAEEAETFFASERGRKTIPFLHKITEQLAAEQARLAEETELCLSKIENIREIISVQQTYSERGGYEVDVDLATLLGDCVTVEREDLTDHHVELEWDIEELPPVSTEKSRLMQILINLLKNAAESIDSFRAEAPADWTGRVLLRLRRSADWALIEISDNGIGVPKELKEQLFSYGFSTKKQGHGYGLHYCANTMKQLGGEIHVESEGHGKGATFICSLKLSESAQQQTNQRNAVL